MTKRPLVHAERHHWWPVSVSKNWIGEDGLIHMIRPDGTVIKAPPKKIARISGAHNIKFQGGSDWDQTYEHEFDSADSSFPRVIKCLEEIRAKHLSAGRPEVGEYLTHDHDEAFLEQLTNCFVSLVVRSPKLRNQVQQLVASLRSSISKEEIKNLTAINLHRHQQEITSSLKSGGKIVLVFSRGRELLFGDGFYHNITIHGVQYSPSVRILVPITPSMAIVYFKPTEYMNLPRLMSLEADAELTALINDSTQVYAKEFLFCRTDMPLLIDSFLAREHQRFTYPDPLDSLFLRIPGVVGQRRGRLFID